MKYLLIIFLLIAAAIYLIRLMINAGTSKTDDSDVVNYVCDECGEEECICRKEDE